MQAYKLKGKIDQSGRLILTEPIDLAPGNVEVIILQEVENGNDSVKYTTETLADGAENTSVPYKTKIFRDWFANSPPVPPDFDPEQARLEYLQEKYR